MTDNAEADLARQAASAHAAEERAAESRRRERHQTQAPFRVSKPNTTYPLHQIAMPDCITHDMVTAALEALGIGGDANVVLDVAIGGGKVVVSAAPRGYGGSVVRTYDVGPYPIRALPREEHQRGRMV